MFRRGGARAFCVFSWGFCVADERKRKKPTANVEMCVRPRSTPSYEGATMVASSNPHSCVLVNSEEQLYSECAIATFPSVFERLSEMRDNKHGCDVFFLVGDNKTKFSAHRVILAAASDVFYANFFGSVMSEDGHSEESPTVIPDVDADAFEMLLQFCYSNQSTPALEIPDDVVVHLLYAAEKYNIRMLKMACLRQLEDINLSNSLTILKQAVFYDEGILIDKCLSIIDENSDEILLSHAFRDCEKTVLEVIIKRDAFSPSSEYDLYKEVVAFAKQECLQDGVEASPSRMREKLGEILYMIRFPLMPISDLLEVARDGLLTNNELGEVMHYIADGSRCPASFNCNPRLRGGQMNHHTRQYNIRKAKGSFDTVRRIAPTEKVDWMSIASALYFESDQPTTLIGFGIYGFCDGRESMSLNDVTVMFGPYGGDTSELSIVNVYSDDSIAHIFLSEGQKLIPNKKYYLCVNLSNAEGRTSRRNIVPIGAARLESASGKCTTFTFDSFGGNTFFPELYVRT